MGIFSTTNFLPVAFVNYELTAVLATNHNAFQALSDFPFFPAQDIREHSSKRQPCNIEHEIDIDAKLTFESTFNFMVNSRIISISKLAFRCSRYMSQQQASTRRKGRPLMPDDFYVFIITPYFFYGISFCASIM